MSFGRTAGVVAVTSARIFKAFYIFVKVINVDNDRRSRRYAVVVEDV